MGNRGGRTRDNRYIGINMVHWNGNTDGIWVSGDGNVMDNCFFFINDDAIVTKGGTGTKVSNLVFWGGRWGRLLLIQNNGLDVSNMTIENVDVIGKEDGPQLILADSRRAPINLRDITFRNIRIEERAGDERTHPNAFIRIRSDRFAGSLTNWLFENVTIDKPFANEGELFGSAELPYRGITFKNLRMDGQLILSAAKSHITINEHTEIKFLPPTP
jgi:hypothetical protein